MRVLIISKNLYKRAGGGETVYRSIIRHLEDYDFYYPTDNIISEKPPINANPYLTKVDIGITYENLLNPIHLENLLIPFKKMSFDIVDLPDYQPAGLHLNDILNKLSIKYKKIILSLHGVMSSYFYHDWMRDFYLSNNKNQLEQIRINEIVQAKYADSIYGISEKYKNDKYFNNKVNVIDPLHLLFNNSPLLNSKEDNQTFTNTIQLVYIGRLDRQKAPDILIDTILMLEKKEKYEILFYSSKDESVKFGEKYLNQMAERRGIKIKFVFDKNTVDIFNEIRKRKSIIIIPSRVDSFNIIALEALLCNIPILIRNTCGASPYLENILGKKFLHYKFENLHEFTCKLNYALKNFKKVRKDFNCFKEKISNYLHTETNINPYKKTKKKENYLFKWLKFLFYQKSYFRLNEIKKIKKIKKLYTRKNICYEKNLQINLFIEEINIKKFYYYSLYILKNKINQKTNIEVRLYFSKVNISNCIKFLALKFFLKYDSFINFFRFNSSRSTKKRYFLYCEGLPYLTTDLIEILCEQKNNHEFSAIKFKNINIISRQDSWFDKDSNLRGYTYITHKKYSGNFMNIQKNINNYRIKPESSNLLIRVDK